jgi:ribosomal protein S8
MINNQKVDAFAAGTGSSVYARKGYVKGTEKVTSPKLKSAAKRKQITLSDQDLRDELIKIVTNVAKDGLQTLLGKALKGDMAPIAIDMLGAASGFIGIISAFDRRDSSYRRRDVIRSEGF